MKRLIILGAGNVGGYLSYNINLFGDYEVLGFLDDDPAKAGKEFYGRQVLGKMKDLAAMDHQGLAVAICIAAPRARAAIATSIGNSSLEFPNFIPPQAWLSERVSVGKGNIIYPGVSINYETTLQDFVIMNMNCAIGHNCQLNSFATLAPGVNLAGFTTLGEGTEVGIGVASRQNVIVGKYATIGGQSMLINSVPDYAVVTGVPGKVIQHRKPV